MPDPRPPAASAVQGRARPGGFGPWRRLAPTAALGALLSAGSAFGRVEATVEYTKPQTYSCALRYLRVDLEYEVTERDPDAAYLIFRYRPPSSKETVSGTIEVIEADTKVRLFVRLPEMPSYHEEVLKNGLLRKLRDEYGEPAQEKPKPKDPPAENRKPRTDDRAGKDPKANPGDKNRSDSS